MSKVDHQDTLRQGLDLTKAGQYARARAVLEPLADQEEGSADPKTIKTARRALAIIALNTKAYETAERRAQEVLALDAGDVLANLILTSVYNNWLRHEKSYETACRVPPAAVPVNMVHTFAQAVIQHADHRRFAALGDVYALLDAAPPAMLPNYLAISGIRNSVFDGGSVARYLALQRKWGNYMTAQAAAQPLEPSSAVVPPPGPRRVRLGFFALSDIFDTQAVLRPILEHLDRGLFETVFAFIENGPGVLTDKTFTRLFDRVVTVPRGDTRDAARALAGLGCDILIDLNGLQQPATRVGAFAWRVAPLQLSWTGRPITTGLPALDYTIVDPVLAGDGEDGEDGAEAALALPGAFACFGAMPDFPLPETLPSARAGRVTYGVNAEPAKFNLATIGLWASVLHRDHAARLVFLRPEYRSAVLQDNVRQEFAQRGIASDRVVFRFETAAGREHMRLYDDIDVLLDCYPMTGGIGMLEALHMGVPAVTLEGPVIQLRVGASHLHAVGLDDLRARDVESYAAKAVALAADTGRRETLRRDLRDRLARSAFCDQEVFAAGFNATMAGLTSHPALAHRNIRPLEAPERALRATIDGRAYALAELPPAAQVQVTKLHAVDRELADLGRKIALARTARAVYARLLTQALPPGEGRPAVRT